jgi:hypothetical protein
MKVVTTVHKAGFEQYGHRWIKSMRNWPAGTEFVMYAEGFTPEGVDSVDVASLPELKAFKASRQGYVAPSYRHDVVRFSNKVFAAAHAFKDHDGIGVWLDADCVTYQPVTEELIRESLAGAYFACFKRPFLYTETGLWIVDCTHDENQAFFDTWTKWFTSGAFVNLPEWHDCTTLDATIRLFEQDNRITAHNLSGEFENTMHPMAKAPLSAYFDHLKGPRKSLGFSPENEHRKAA